LIGVVAAHKHPDVFHEVKITQTNFEHTCQLSPTFLREAQRKGGHLKLDIPSLKMALDLLRLHPTTEARILRPCLVRALPNWHALDSAVMSLTSAKGQSSTGSSMGPTTMRIQLSLRPRQTR
jgi:hypothetical protein